MVAIDFVQLNRELEENAEMRTHSCIQPFTFDYFFFNVFFSKRLKKILNDARNYTDVDYYFDLESNGIKLFVKRLIRKFLRFLFIKNFETQRSYNSILLKAENLLYRSLAEMQEQHIRDMETIRLLEARLDKLEAEHERQ